MEWEETNKEPDLLRGLIEVFVSPVTENRETFGACWERELTSAEVARIQEVKPYADFT